MRELEVVLAIALTFLVFSSFVSMFVEIGFRFLAVRFKDLKNMLGEFYDKELSILLNNGDGTNKQSFVNHVTKLSANNYSIDVAEFIERLASSDMAGQIKQELKTDTELLVNEFARRYDNYGKAASFTFKQKAAKLNMVLSILLALALNINIVTLAYAFLENRSLTDQLINQTPLILEQAELQQKSLENAIAQATASTENTDALTDFTDSVNKLSEAVTHIDTLALPIGWSNYDSVGIKEVLPIIVCENQHAKFCLNADAWVYGLVNFVVWIFVTLATGLLIGLGGPFWFDMVRKIGAARSLFTKQAAVTATTDNQQNSSSNMSDLHEMRKNLAVLFEQTYQANQLLKTITSNDSSAKS